MPATRDGPGRPPLPEGEGHEKSIRIRIRTTDLETVRDAAASEGETVSEFMRKRALRAARRLLSG